MCRSLSEAVGHDKECITKSVLLYHTVRGLVSTQVKEVLPQLSSYCVPGGFHAGIEGCASTVHALREARPTYASPSTQFQAGFLEFFISRSCCSIDIVLCVNLHISCDGRDCCNQSTNSLSAA